MYSRTRRRIRRRPTEKKSLSFLPSIVLTVFLTLGTTHMVSFYDFESQLEKLFPTAVAEQQIAVPTVAKSQTIVAMPATPKVATKNPFMVPSKLVIKPVSAMPNGAGGVPSGSGAALNGVISSNGASIAIININGSSGQYRVGENINGYTVMGIGSNYVDLYNDGDTRRLTLGGNSI